MASAPPSTPRRRPPRTPSGSSRRGKLVPEQYLLLPGKSTWDDYLRLDRRHCSYALRLAFAGGQLEFMSISEDHERIKRMIGSLIEAWCLDHDIPFDAAGSATRRIAGRHAGEPDDSFFFPRRGRVPDLVVEVQIARPGLSKLEFYAALGVPEVWIWHDQAIQVWNLHKGAYSANRESAALPGFDLAFAAKAAATMSVYDAIKALRQRRKS